MPIAYSYQRFSSAKQEGNDSIRRQTLAAQRYIGEHPELRLVLDQTMSMVDAGVSAYRGSNMKSGALGVFMDYVRNDLIESGSFFLIESFDRFTRQQVNLAAAELLTLINYGIVIVTLNNGNVYRAEDFMDGGGLVQLLGALIAMEGHHKEQVEKGKRVAAAWSTKYAAVKEGHILSTIAPFWLSVPADKIKFVIRHERVAIVQEIFQRRSTGEGKAAIAADLTVRNIPTPKGHSNVWHPSAVQKILNSEAVVGRFVNSRGESFENYYPAVIEQGLYQVVKALRKQTETKGANVAAHPLAGLIKHDCGTTMRRINKGSGYVRLSCPLCRKGIPYPIAIATALAAIDELEWAVAPTEQGQQIFNVMGYLHQLSDDIENAYLKWRELKTLESKEHYDRLVNEQAVERANYESMQGLNTETLVAMEELAIRRCEASPVKAFKAITLAAGFDHELTTLTIKSISGKTVCAPVIINLEDFFKNAL